MTSVPADAVFYDRDGDAYLPTDWTRGPWDANAQHAGPPSALLGRAIDQLEGGAQFAVARFTVELARSITLEPMTIEARLLRGGKRVQLVEAILRQAGDDVALARAWRIRRDETAAEATATEAPPFAGPGQSTPSDAPDPWDGPSYFTAVEWRDAAGTAQALGAAALWMRMKVGLLGGEPPSPLTRVLVAADSGNGISRELPFETHVFINTELSVHLFAEAAGEWVGVDARTRIGPGGAGVASTALYDQARRIGSGNQALLIRRR